MTEKSELHGLLIELHRTAQALTGHDTVRILPLDEIAKRGAANDAAHTAILDRFAALKERSDSYRSRLKNLAALCGMASSKLCAPVSEKDIQSAKSCVETGIYVMRDLIAEEKSLESA